MREMLKQKGIADTLVRNKTDLNILDHQGQNLLHKALNKGTVFRLTSREQLWFIW